jgi:hypothetical protein
MLRPDSISASVSALFKRLKIPKPKGNALHLFRHYAGFRTIPGELKLGLLGGSLASIFPA